MTEKTIYIADDGTEFNDEYDCQMYERECRINPMFDSGDIMMWDRNKKRTTDFEDAFYVMVKNLFAARILKDIFDEYGYECPCYDSWAGELRTGRFYYDNDYDKWHNLEELKIMYDNLSEIFAN